MSRMVFPSISSSCAILSFKFNSAVQLQLAGLHKYDVTTGERMQECKRPTADTQRCPTTCLHLSACYDEIWLEAVAVVDYLTLIIGPSLQKCHRVLFTKRKRHPHKAPNLFLSWVILKEKHRVPPTPNKIQDPRRQFNSFMMASSFIFILSFYF